VDCAAAALARHGARIIIPPKSLPDQGRSRTTRETRWSSGRASPSTGPGSRRRAFAPLPANLRHRNLSIDRRPVTSILGSTSARGARIIGRSLIW
jgi:hypothetical protein